MLLVVDQRYMYVIYSIVSASGGSSVGAWGYSCTPKIFIKKPKYVYL